MERIWRGIIYQRHLSVRNYIKKWEAELEAVVAFLESSDEKAIDKIGTQYEAIKNTLSNLLSDLTPAPFCQEPINPRIEKLFQEITTLRDLACQ